MRKKKSILRVLPAAFICAIVFACAAYFSSDSLGLYTYRAQSKILTTSKKNVEDGKNLAITYAASVDSDSVKSKVLEDLDIDITPSQLDRKLTIVPVANSSVINFVVEDRIKLKAEDLADQYADQAVKTINDTYNTDSEVLEYSYQTASKKSLKNIVSPIVGIGVFLIYFIIGSIVTLISNALVKEDGTKIVEIKEEKTNLSSKNLENVDTIPVIGQIKEFEDGDFNV